MGLETTSVIAKGLKMIESVDNRVGWSRPGLRS